MSKPMDDRNIPRCSFCGKQQNQVTESDAGYDILNSRKFSDTTVEDHMVSAQIESTVRSMKTPA